MLWNRIKTVLALLGGLIILGFGIYQLSDEASFRLRSSPATAVVRSYSGRSRGNGTVRLAYECDRPVIASAPTSWYYRPEEGDEVAVHYAPDAPQSPRVAGFAQRWLTPLLLILIGALGLWSVARDLRRWPGKPPA
jgi:hypothetical protein